MKSAILKYDVTRASFFTPFVSIAKFEPRTRFQSGWPRAYVIPN